MLYSWYTRIQIVCVLDTWDVCQVKTKYLLWIDILDTAFLLGMSDLASWVVCMFKFVSDIGNQWRVGYTIVIQLQMVYLSETKQTNYRFMLGTKCLSCLWYVHFIWLTNVIHAQASNLNIVLVQSQSTQSLILCWMFGYIK